MFGSWHLPLSVRNLHWVVSREPYSCSPRNISPSIASRSETPEDEGDQVVCDSPTGTKLHPYLLASWLLMRTNAHQSTSERLVQQLYLSPATRHSLKVSSNKLFREATLNTVEKATLNTAEKYDTSNDSQPQTPKPHSNVVIHQQEIPPLGKRQR